MALSEPLALTTAALATWVAERLAAPDNNDNNNAGGSCLGKSARAAWMGKGAKMEFLILCNILLVVSVFMFINDNMIIVNSNYDNQNNSNHNNATNDINIHAKIIPTKIC